MKLHNYNSLFLVRLYDDKDTSISEQLNKLVASITYGIYDKKTLIIIDNIKLNNKFVPISHILNITEINNKLDEWNISIMDRNDYIFNYITVKYGVNDNDSVDVTHHLNIKDGNLILPHSFNVNQSLGSDPYPGKEKQLYITSNCNQMKIVHTIKEYCEKLLTSINFNFKNIILNHFESINEYKNDDSDNIYVNVLDIIISNKR